MIRQSDSELALSMLVYLHRDCINDHYAKSNYSENGVIVRHTNDRLSSEAGQTRNLASFVRGSP